MHDAALACLRAGLSVMPALLAEKRPALPSWKAYRERLPTEAEVRSWFGPGTPMCVVTGAVSGHLEMIDFDQRGELFDRWAAGVEEIAPGLVARLYVERSQRGGRHVVYRCEAPVCGNLKLAQRPGRTGEDKAITLIETRGEGGLFLCAPTAGYVATQGNLAALPALTSDERDVLLGCAWALDEPPRTHRHAVGVGVVSVSSASDGAGVVRPGDDFNARGDVREVLRAHGWRQVRAGDAGGNEHWCRPGKEHGTSATLKDGVFYVFSSNAPPFEPQQGYAPFAVYAMLGHNGDFAAAASALREKGYGSEPDVDGDVDLSAFAGATASGEEPAEPAFPHPGPFPPHLLRVPGLLGDIVGFTLSSSMYPQPTLALAAGVALMGTITGRKVRDEFNTRTNVYCVALCETGGGKERARQVNKEILFQAGLAKLVGPEGLASHAGVVSAVHRQPSILFQLDEIGRLLKTIGEPTRTPHLYHIATVLMKMFTSSGSVYIGDAYADPDNNRSINQPHACVYGTTVRASLCAGLTHESMTDGFVPRMLVFETDDSDPDPVDVRIPDAIPEPILAAVRWWGDYKPGGNLSPENPAPAVVPYNGEARSLMSDFTRRARAERRRLPEAAGALWTRAAEKARKLALLFACSRDRENLLVDEAAARWGIELTDYLTRRLLAIAEDWIAETPFEAKRKRLLRDLKASAAGLTRTQLYRKTKHLTGRERSELIESLVSTGEIVEHREATRGAPRVVFRASCTSSPYSPPVCSPARAVRAQEGEGT
jgi:hypothetical protein